MISQTKVFKGQSVLLEFVREGFFVQKYIWIVEFLVESVLQLFHALDDPRQITIPSQHNYDCVGFTLRMGR